MQAPSFFDRGGASPGGAGSKRPFGSPNPRDTKGEDDKNAKLAGVIVRLNAKNKLLEIEVPYKPGNVNEQLTKDSLTKLMQRSLIQVHGKFKDRAQTQPNPVYEANIRGWNCINRDGTDWLVTFDEIGALAKAWIDDDRHGLQKLVNANCIEPVTMEIFHTALNVDHYETVDAFKVAIDAVPNPAEYITPGATKAASDAFQAQTITAINEIFSRLTTLERRLNVSDGSSSGGVM